MNTRVKKVSRENIERLYRALSKMGDQQECERVLEDLCTISEIQAMAQRLEVAFLLDKDISYTDIAEQTGASSATVSRVSKCLNYGNGGYRLLMDRTEGDEI